jgi:hypothetical protein
MMSWREQLEKLPPEQRILVEGGSLSQRFSKQPLTLTHPALIGGFYGFISSMALLLPFCYENGWTQDTIRDLAFLSVLLMLILAITGHFSIIVSQILKRPPISLRRGWVYPMPFIGLSILSVMLVTGLESELSDNISTWIRYIGWTLLLAPGPVYVHMSWAPRWRLLCRFEGLIRSEPAVKSQEGSEDSDMEKAIEDIEDDPPLLHVADGEE